MIYKINLPFYIIKIHQATIMTVNNIIIDSYGRQYSRDSFDRFGDDLTELILSFMTFEDKIRLECVAKQWRRLIFNKQYAIGISRSNPKETKDSLIGLYRRSRIKIKALKTVLKKCRFITTVRLYSRVDSQVLSLIGRNCPGLKSLYYKDNDGKHLDFFRMYGHKLEELSLWGDFEEIRFCPNLRKVSVWQRSILFETDHEILPKLEFIGLRFRVNSKDVNKVRKLSDKYSQTLKTLNVSIDGGLTEEEVKTNVFIDGICRFENLTKLELTFHMSQKTEPIDDCLSLIGRKCTKLLDLNFICLNTDSLNDTFFTAFSEFKAIKKLKIYLLSNREVKGSVECFKPCKQLFELDINHSQLSEQFFTNVDTFLPNLQTLQISSVKQFSDSFIHSFQSSKFIEKVVLDNVLSQRKSWYFGKCLSEVMLGPDGKNIIPVNDKCGLIY